MNVRTVAATTLLALFVTACSGGGGSSPAPNSVAPVGTSGTGSSAAPGSTGTTAVLPPGTIGVTLTIRIPAHKHSSSALRAGTARALNRIRGAAATLRKPLFISPNTTGVTAVVTPTAQSPFPMSTGTCTPAITPTSCTIVIPIPIFVGSTVVVSELGQQGEPIGLASATYTAGQFTEGTAQAAPPLTFQPIVGQIAVVDTTDFFTEGTPNGSLTAFLQLTDPDTIDIGGETDGVVDSTGTPLTSVTLSGSGGVTVTSTSFSLLATNPASDQTITASYDGTGIPMINVSLSPPSSFPGIFGFDGTGVTAVHGLTFDQAPGPFEYPSSDAAFAQGSDFFSLTEQIGTDASAGISITTSGGCASITAFSGTLLPGGGPYNFTVPYLTSPPAYNGVCTITATDNPQGNTASFTIGVNQVNITVNGKSRRK